MAKNRAKLGSKSQNHTISKISLRRNIKTLTFWFINLKSIWNKPKSQYLPFYWRWKHHYGSKWPKMGQKYGSKSPNHTISKKRDHRNIKTLNNWFINLKPLWNKPRNQNQNPESEIPLVYPTPDNWRNDLKWWFLTKNGFFIKNGGGGG